MERPDVAHLARLARLRLESGEREQLAGDLGRMLAHFHRLQELDTSGVEPTTHPLDLSLQAREDLAGDCLGHDLALSNAPDQADGCFRVPAVLPEA